VKAGAFVRTDSSYRSVVSPEAGATYPAESGRYHLYVAYACPWAHRALMVRKLKGLEPHIGVSVVSPTWERTKPDDANDSHCGWVFNAPDDPPKGNSDGFGSFTHEDCVPDGVNGCRTVRELYDKAGFTGKKFTVPLLWDKVSGTIVNNESSELVRIFNSAFDGLPGVNKDLDLYPEALRPAIDAENEWIYHDINNGARGGGGGLVLTLSS
jgi:glutathionyl-hydroquinone reductase